MGHDVRAYSVREREIALRVLRRDDYVHQDLYQIVRKHKLLPFMVTLDLSLLQQKRFPTVQVLIPRGIRQYKRTCQG